tara:strand:+ start:1495 stop:2979 length:1485 start_codon:yes stop_codon:yes gene_type:complete
MAVSNSNCGSSLLNPSVCIQGAGTVGSKLALTITQSGHGFSAGSVVRWNSGIDGNAAQYVQAKADNAYNAEVIGVVSDVLSGDSFELTLSGVVKMNQFFSNTTGAIPAGSTQDDVFFLSGYTAGWMDVKRPRTPGWVAKPIITRLAEDSSGNIFGMVTNYVGSLLGGNVVTSLGQIVPVGTINSWLGSQDKVPAGWCLCDGEGPKDGNNIPGVKVENHSEYHSVVGKEYGWVECLKTDDASVSIGEKVQQIVVDEITGIEKNIVGVVVGASGGIEEDGRRYLFISQTINDVDLDEQNSSLINGNFAVVTPNERIQGESDLQTRADYYKTPNGDLFEFSHSSVGVVANKFTSSGESIGTMLLFGDSSAKVGVFSLLPPDLRNKFILGAKDQDTDRRGRVGGNELISRRSVNGDESEMLQTDRDGGDVGYWTNESNMPPYVTTNWIVRIDPNASAAIIDTLEIDNIRLQNLPTSGSGQEQWTVYRHTDDTLKITTS